MTDLKTLGEHACFGGTVSFHEHHSSACDAGMRFAAYVPPQAAEKPVPVLYYLAGLTSTEETFMIKGGAQRLAAEYGLILVAGTLARAALGCRARTMTGTSAPVPASTWMLQPSLFRVTTS
jgi:S-formylglutathione hydrolase FrmB